MIEMINEIQLIFSQMPVMIFVSIGSTVILLILTIILEDVEYNKTYRNLPVFLRPSKSWWKENKDYVRTMSSHRETNK